MPETSNIPNLSEFLSDESNYINLLDNPSIWRSIPLLNYIPVHELRDLSMVRFRGMIQDMLDPEIYLEKYQVIPKIGEGSSRIQNGKYRDCLLLQSNESVNYESKENIQSERKTIFVVSLPAINPWVSTFEQESSSKQGYSTALSTQLPKADKRPINQGNTGNVDHKVQADKHNKRQCYENGQDTTVSALSSSLLSMEYLLNSPIPDRPSKACMIKLYSDFDSHTLNSIVDVVGFLSVDPALDVSSTDCCDAFENLSEMHAQNPPPSLIPRLHAVAVKKLSHNNPLVDPLICEITTPDINFEFVYKELKILLTQCLLGDDLAAEYLLAHLISTVYNRSDIHCIGKFSLNICNLPQEVLPSYTQELYDLLELFLPASHYLPMTLDTMNTLQFFPKKDYETNKLTSGILQLAPHTHLVLDESRLQPGVLQANGIRGVQSLEHLIKTQQIKCNFHYYDLDFNMNIPVLVLSEGRSLLPNDFLVPLKADSDCVGLISETLKAAKHYAQTKLDGIRRYLTLAKICNFGMNPKDSEMIQTDFVEMRKTNTKIGADELHGLLVLSRLLAIARGKSGFDRECWEQAKSMEMLRRIRVENMPKSDRS